MRLLQLSCFILILIQLLLSVNGFIQNDNKIESTPTIALKKREGEPTNTSTKSKTDNNNKNDPTRITTEIDVIYTTIIVETITPSPPPVIYNMSDTGSSSAHQQQQQQPIGAAASSSSSSSYAPPSNSPNVNDPNKDSNGVAENLQKDKEALDRMIMILSLVGGLGVIAIVATLVIFTRMRARNRKQRELDAEDGYHGGGNHDNDSSHSSTFELSNDAQPMTNFNQSQLGQGGRDGSSAGHTRNSSMYSIATTTHSSNEPFMVPSAPPALLLVEDDDNPLIHIKEAAQQYQRTRRNILSMSSQTTAAPVPSAPTAKELDAMADAAAAEASNSSSSSSDNSSTSSHSNHIYHYTDQHPIQHHHHHHHHHSNHLPQTSSTSCSRCALPSILPELPPPAYTPSAPPHYDLPVESPIIIESANSSNNIIPSRRHSLGG